MNQGMLVDSTSWRARGNGSWPRAYSKERSPENTLIFSAARLTMSTLLLWLRRFSSLAVWEQALFTGKYSFESCWMVPPALGSFLSHTADQYCWILKWSDPPQISGLCFLCVCPYSSVTTLSMPATLFSLDAQLCLLRWGGAVGSAFVSPPYTVAWKCSQNIKLNRRRLIALPFLKDHLPLLPFVQCLEILFHIFLLFFFHF